ncbi:hypothetical protein B2D07_00750 [Desulfococcus multivorans]|nr:hypothetical protein B2D07_00750 [Desulfococcus multivorans]
MTNMKCNPRKITPIGSLFLSFLVLMCIGHGTVVAETGMSMDVPPIDDSRIEGVKARRFPSATQLESVYAARQGKGLKVFVGADGMIADYKAFTVDDPPRIVFDLFHIKSPYDQEKVIPVDTEWVQRIRYAGETDKVRIILETNQRHLIEYKADPVENGLLIQVGAGADQLTMNPVAAAPVQKTTDVKLAGITRIDFIGAETGESVLVVETTRPVKYETQAAGDNRLTLQLFNTRLPDHRKRPLITDRFKSAVDEITPKTQASNPNTALFDIKLREAVPYSIEQEGNALEIRFDASVVPPRPLAGIAAAEKKQLPPPTSGIIADKMDKPKGMEPIKTAAAPLPEPMPSSVPDLDLEEDLGVIDDLPVYTGERIALDFYETDIKNVFRILREVSARNFAIDKDVTGKVTLTLAEPVPWDQILDLILKMNKLGKTVEGNIIRIATRATLAEEAQLRRESRAAELAARDQQQQLEPLFTEYLPVNYSNAGKEIRPHIEKMLTLDRGNVSVDERTNMIIITDTAEKIKKARELISKLDRVTPQVIIEGRVVEASTNFTKEIGTTWQAGIGVQQVGTGVTQEPDDSAVNIGGATDTVTDTVNDRVGVGPQKGYNDLGGTYGYNMAVDFPIAASDYGSIGFNFMRIAGTPFLLNAKLHAMESQGEAKIVSAPKVVTLDNKTALIKQGVDYPYQSVDDEGNPKTEFKSIDLKLEVTPHVTPDNRINMVISITKNDLGEVIAGEQSFTTKEARTELLVNDGDTVVIGGIIKTASRQNMEGVPYLNRVPILGWLFKAEGSDDQKEELLIFITPRIIQLEQRLVQF